MEVFWEKRPLTGKFSEMFFKCPTEDTDTSFCVNFVKFGRPEVGEIARCLMDKNKISARPPAAASAWIAPKICQGQLQTIDSEFPKFHPNLFTSGGVIAERVNIVQTRHKVFAILSEASASSPSNNHWKNYADLLYDSYTGTVSKWLKYHQAINDARQPSNSLITPKLGKMGHPDAGSKHTVRVVGKICGFWPIPHYILEMIQDVEC